MINSFSNEYDFLSNFYPSSISDGYVSFPTVEHYFQAAKTTGASDYMSILHAKTPGQAKSLGKHIQLRPDWEDVKDSVMEGALRKKFAIPVLRDKLLATGDEYLEEGNNWHDNYWGVCYCIKCQDTVAKNNLGKMLMKLREELRQEKNKCQN